MDIYKELNNGANREITNMKPVGNQSCYEYWLECTEMYGEYDVVEAAKDHALHMLGLKTDNMLELTYPERKRVHNLKYYTWVEQQGKTVEELNALWYGTEFADVHTQAAAIDELITAFNEEAGNA